MHFKENGNHTNTVAIWYFTHWQCKKSALSNYLHFVIIIYNKISKQAFVVFNPLLSLFFSLLLFTGFFFSVSLCTLTIRFALEMHFAGGQKACCVSPEMHFILVAVDWHGPASFQNEYTVYRGKSRAHPRYFTSKIPG
jgi:hypothetical protein